MSPRPSLYALLRILVRFSWIIRRSSQMPILSGACISDAKNGLMHLINAPRK
jgi:hypothetical protein